MFVHANIATVPAFAPVHEYADWYWAFLETEARHRVAPDVPAARGRRVAPGALRRPAVRRLHPRPDLRALRRRRVRAAPRRRGHALPRARHQASRRLLLVGHRAHRPQLGALGPKRDVVAELADAVRRRGPRVRLLLLAARLGSRRLSRRGALRRRVHAAADPGAGRAVRARGAVGRRPLGSSRRALARRPRSSATRATYAAAHGFELVCNDRFFASRSRLRHVRVRRARGRRPTGRGSCAAVSASRSASTATSASTTT